MTAKTDFWARVDRTDQDSCWEWRGRLDRDGYGQWGKTGAHRFAYLAVIGPIPSGLHLDHVCRNRRCVNPDHLEPVTPRENILRGVGIPAMNAVKTHCIRGHEFTPENTLTGTQNGYPRRWCRACRKVRERAA